MIKINYENVGDFNLPTEWSEISLKKFQEVGTLSTENETNFEVSLISVLTGIPIDKIYDLPIVEYKKLLQATSFINKNPNTKPQIFIKIEDVEYGYRHDIVKMKTKEYIDFDTLSNIDPVANMHILMAILYRPIIRKGKDLGKELDYELEDYDSEDVIKRAEIFKEHMKMDTVLSSSFFLTILGHNLLQSIQDSLENQEVHKKTKIKKLTRMKIPKKIFRKNGVG
jgi:hypothetical protein